MTRVDVAYGIPEKLGEKRLLAALEKVNGAFDESPKEMHAILAPPGLEHRTVRLKPITRLS